MIAEATIPAGRGVLPLSYSELARVHPSLWATAEDVRNSFEQIRILDVILRPGVSETPSDVLPEPIVLPTLTAPEHAVVSDVFVFGRHRLVVEVIAPWRGSPQWEAAA